MKKISLTLAGIMVLALVLLVVSCGGATPATTPAKTTTPAATTVKPTTPVATTPAATTAKPTTPALSGPPKAPKAMHEALYSATPAGCTGCHTVGGAGVGVPGGTGIPADHTGRTNETCKGCHQLSS